MGRKVVRIADQPTKKRFVGKYRQADGSIKVVQLCTHEEIDRDCGPHTPRNARKRESYLDALYDHSRPSDKPTTPVSLNQWIDLWLEDIAATRHYKTWKQYGVTMRFLQEQKARKFEYVCVVRLTAKLRESGLKTTSINSHLRAVRVFANWYAEQVGEAPIKIKMLRELKGQTIKSYTIDQVEQIEDYILKRAATPSNRPDHRRWPLLFRAVQFMRYTGMRGGEIHTLTWERVDLKNKKILLTDDASFGEDEFFIKGRHASWVPLHPALHSYIEKHCLERKPRGRVLEGYWAHLNELSASFAKIAKELGIKGVKPMHGFRATYATQLHEQGVPSLVVQRLMRHSSITTTRLYFDDNNADLHGAINVL